MYVYAVGQDGVWREIRYLSTSGSTSLFRKKVEMVLQACKRLVLAISWCWAVTIWTFFVSLFSGEGNGETEVEQGGWKESKKQLWRRG